MNKRIFIGCTIGNIIEWYDFMIYAALSPILADLFFPKQDVYVSMMLTFGIFAAGFLMRPVGAIFFGHIGDTRGRRKAMIISTLAIAIPSLCVAFLPTYQSVGLLSAVLLLVARLMQGFAIGGEHPSLVSYLNESSPKEKKIYYGSYVSTIPLLGIILATLVNILLNNLLSSNAMHQFGWRIPFLLSFFLLMLGLFYRTLLPETPVFKKLETLHRYPIFEVFKSHKMAMLRIMLYGWFCSVPFYLFTVFSTFYLTKFLHFSYHFSVVINLVSSLMLLAMLPAAGKLLQHGNRRNIVLCATLGLCIFAYPIFVLLASGQIWKVLLSQFMFAFLLSFILAAVGSFIAEQVQDNVRVTATGFSYSVSMALFGGTTPVICIWLIHALHSIYAPLLYLFITSIIGIITIAYMKPDTTIS